MTGQYWSARIQRWLDKRIPKANQFALDMRSIFIFPSRFGFLYLLLCLTLFLLGTNYQNNLMLFLCYFLLALFLVNLLSAYQNFARLQVQLGKTRSVFAGDAVQLPLWLDPQSSEHAAHGKIIANFWQQPTRMTVDLDSEANPHIMALPAVHRGENPLPRITLNSYYPLGLFRCWTHLAFDNTVIVYPRPEPCSFTLTQIDTDQSEGENHPFRQGYDEFDSLKPYQQGDPLNHIAWKHLARGRGMISKQFTSLANETVWLQLKPYPVDTLEHQLSQLCFQILELSKQDSHFGLDLGAIRIEPDSGSAHQTRCLEALARFKVS